MSLSHEVVPEQLFEQQRMKAEADYVAARFDHMERFFEAHPDLAATREVAIENMTDLEEYPVHDSGVTYEEPQYRWAEANYAWVTAQEQRAFLAEQRADIHEQDESVAAELDAFLADLDDEVALRDYMRNVYDVSQSVTRAEDQTRLFDFPTTQGVGPDWVGIGDQLIEARLQRSVFHARYVASGYQDYGYAPHEGHDKAEELMHLRDGRNLPIPGERRFFVYQPFTRDPRDMIDELAQAKAEIGDDLAQFFDMRTAQMLVEDEKTADEPLAEAKEVLAERLAWWEELPSEEQTRIIHQAEQYSYAVQHTYRQLTAGFAPVINMAIDKVKSVYPHAHDKGNFKKLQEDAILSAAFYFSRVDTIMDMAGKDHRDVGAIMGYLYAQIIVGFNNVVLDKGKRIDSKRLHKIFDGTGGLEEVVFDEGYFDNDAFVPERLQPFTLRELSGFKPKNKRARGLGAIGTGATITLSGSRTLKRTSTSVLGLDPLKGVDDKIAEVAAEQKRKGLILPGLEKE